MVNGAGFDKWLEQELQDAAKGQSGPSPMPAQAQYHAAYLRGGQHVSVLAKVLALVSTKAALGLAFGVLAVSAAGMASEAAITGSTDPGNWGQQVVQQVQKCKAALSPGTHGIGDCVSAFASKHGQQVSSDHRASAARLNDGHQSDHDNGKPTDHPTGKPTDHPTGKPTHHPTGKPTDLPVGPGQHP